MDAVEALGVAVHPLPTRSTDAAADFALLDATERQRARRFVRPQHAAAYVATHAALRRLLAPTDPAGLAYIVGPWGKPAIDGPGPHFSLSHCDGLAWVAVSTEAAVGMDVEPLRPLPDLARVAADVMDAHEHRAWLALPEPERLPAFVRLWTRKEAALKCWGLGLTRAPATLATGWGHRDAGHTVEGLWLHTTSYNGCVLSWARAASDSGA